MHNFICLFIVIFACAVPTQSFALRCGSDLVEIGDLKIEVKLACGEPLSKEIIGYIDQVRYKVDKSYSESKSNDDKYDTEERIKVMNIEEWIVKESNSYYSLVFEGNRLKEIERANR